MSVRQVFEFEKAKETSLYSRGVRELEIEQCHTGRELGASLWRKSALGSLAR